MKYLLSILLSISLIASPCASKAQSLRNYTRIEQELEKRLRAKGIEFYSLSSQKLDMKTAMESSDFIVTAGGTKKVMRVKLVSVDTERERATVAIGELKNLSDIQPTKVTSVEINLKESAENNINYMYAILGPAFEFGETGIMIGFLTSLSIVAIVAVVNFIRINQEIAFELIHKGKATPSLYGINKATKAIVLSFDVALLAALVHFLRD